MINSRLFLLCLATVVLPACQDQLELPPERKMGAVTGKVVDGIVAGARITAYAFGDGSGRRLGGTTTDADGNYSLNVQAGDQIILIEASAGSYVEQATGNKVSFPEGDVMRAMVPYRDGQDVDAIVTPLTHLTAGLVVYKVNQGMSASRAYDEAKTEIDEFFNIDTTNTLPIDITQAGDAVNTLSGEALYGFYLAGISSWALWAGNKNRVAPHTTYTSISVLQVMYNDIRSDGVLDGRGFDLDEDNLMPLAIGVVPLDATLYRAAFSLHILAVSIRDTNSTRLGPDDLRPVAEELAAASSDLFSGDTLDINSQAPKVSLPTLSQSVYSGVITLPVEIGGFLDAASVAMFVDGTFAAELANPQNPELTLDTAAYPPDGEHVITVSATDILDHTASADFRLRTDNTNPVINVTSPAVTNTTIATVSGTYNDNTAGVESIIVNGQPAVLDQQNNWSATIPVSPGENVVNISVFDFANNETRLQTVVFLDNIDPVINTGNGHSNARFSDGSGGYTTAPLQDDNASTALFIETSRLDLDGVPITRADLDSNLIPYFAFGVSDERSPDNPAPFADLEVRVQYEKNGTVLSPWRILPVPDSGNEYLVPLASETLNPGWDQASHNETHTVRVEVTDPAGNVTTSSFSFRADFYVPSLNTANVTTADLGLDIFTATDFAYRADLNNMEFASTRYATIINPVNESIYIQPQDTSTHTVEHVVEQLVREHRVRLITGTQWRISLMPVSQRCPDSTPPSWQIVTLVYNRVNGSWEPRTPPSPVNGPVEYAPDDNLPDAPAPTLWSDVPHFDGEFASGGNTVLGLTMNYSFDYILALSTEPTAAYVANWTVTNDEGVVVATCPDAQLFQQREIYSYQSEPGYPQPVVSDVTLTGSPTFSTTGFAVFDNSDNIPVQPVNGWYHIPAGHSFSVTKSVTTPPLANYNSEISDTDNATYTPMYYDQAISWFVNREIGLSVIHDAGQARIPDMLQHMNPLTGGGVMTYSISR